MNQKSQLDMLIEMVGAIDDVKSHCDKLKRKSMIMTAVALVGLVISFILYFQQYRGLYIVLLASFSGILYGLSMYIDNAVRQWPVIASLFDVEAIQHEICELESDLHDRLHK